ncbi:MAG: hypothetical protein RMZ41_031655 [Nostoc sp. DedVER02]|uniref:hypothetical protein n=1 Tax=unclassified Nostoc TaxID=2593658 RepID=UPI002AD55E79|nr:MULTISPECIES: hypothetical protein [unclassified Nostoc]MDZ7988472.1 hypothetical protein [Nostoc sp. DedVER02]MDZ8112773.1 hypothetical protein [Nostoc sp. DedVER01b]
MSTDALLRGMAQAPMVGDRISRVYSSERLGFSTEVFKVALEEKVLRVLSWKVAANVTRE